MAMVDGQTIWDGSMPGSTPENRRATYEAMIDTLAALHKVDVEAAGLSDFGKPGNYFGRQVDRWTKQYKLAETETMDEMETRQDDMFGDYPLDELVESDLADTSGNQYVALVEKFAEEHHGAGTCIVSAAVEAELIDFDSEEAAEYLESLGVKDSGVSLLIRATYDLLGLASYFTAGVQEVRAWTFKSGMKAPQCAGVIHTDFEHGFIKAEVVAYDDLIAAGNVAKARDAGKYRLEGKEY